MADLKTTLKQAWLKTMESVGTAASNIASNTRHRLDEMNLINRRREILSDLSNRAYELWQKGVAFPAPMQELLTELTRIDESLNTLRTEKLAGVNTADPQHPAPENPASTTDESPAPVSDAVPTMDAPAAEKPGEAQRPLEDSIDALFSTAADRAEEAMTKAENAVNAVERAVEGKAEETGAKMQGVLDAIEEHVVTFGQHLGNSIDTLTQALTSDDTETTQKDDANHPQA